MHELKRLLKERISSGLLRRAITSTSRWSEMYRVMGKPFPGKWTFDHHPWTREMHDCTDELVVGQKAAQMGFTETCLNICFKAIDIDGKSVLYIMPTSDGASDFSTARFDPALELSPHLQNLFSNVKNIGHKRAGSASLYVRGSRSRSKLKEIPVGLVIFDEVDEMVMDHVSLALERMSGQVTRQAYMVSTPSFEGFGIHQYFEPSSQDHFFFPCPHCGKWTELIFPECLVITADDEQDPKIRDTYIICKECKNKLDHKTKPEWLKDGKWVAQYENRLTRGFQINQLYSMTVDPYKLAQLYITSKTSVADEQEFYNSKLGQTHVVAGARLLDSDINQCIGNYKQSFGVSSNAFITMGVDVGKRLHVIINEWQFDSKGTDISLMAKPRMIKAVTVNHFEELDDLMRRYSVRYCVIDNQPETRKALEFARRFNGHVSLCIYGRCVSGRDINVKDAEYTVTVNRSNWFDLYYDRFRNKRISLPIDITLEYRKNLKALVKIYKPDPETQKPIGKYVRGKDADHYAHAGNYAEIALRLGASIGTTKDITGVL